MKNIGHIKVRIVASILDEFNTAKKKQKVAPMRIRLVQRMNNHPLIVVFRKISPSSFRYTDNTTMRRKLVETANDQNRMDIASKGTDRPATSTGFNAKKTMDRKAHKYALRLRESRDSNCYLPKLNFENNLFSLYIN